jgi:uncharacterized membrane protein
MITNFTKYSLANTLAVIVLIALIVAWIVSLILSLRDVPIPTNKGWYARLLPIFTLLGIPAVIDLLETRGLTVLFAGLVAIVLLLNIVIPVLQMVRKTAHPFVTNWYKWSIPISVVGGLAVAGYLTFIETTGTVAVCGPLGGCQEVQTSRYATLFGILPVGLLGFLGYVAILVAWLVWQFGPGAMQKMAVLSIWGMCIFGVLFSIYLTFLEPFVIGATCMWCISSAVLMIILLLVSTPAAQQALTIVEE